MYKAGTFNFPTSAGVFAVTGLGFTPQAVFLFGSNRAELDSLVVSAGRPGLFFSINGLDYSARTTVRSLCLSWSGRSQTDGVGFGGIQSPTGCIRMMPDNAASSTGVEYRAGPMSFDADGFSFNVDTPAPGVRPVHWLAVGGNRKADGVPFQCFTMRQNVGGLSPTFPTPIRTFTTVVVNSNINNGAAFTQNAVNGQAWWGLGSGHYPEYAPNDSWYQTAIVYTKIIQGTSIGTQGFTDDFVNFSGATSHVIGSVGPAFTEGLRSHRPQVFGGTTYLNSGGGQANMYEEAIWWNGEGHCNFVSAPAAGGVSSVAAPAHFTPIVGGPREWEAVLFTTINGGNASAGESQLRYGFGILTPTYQGCAVMGQDGSFFQSRTHCFANVTAAGVESAIGAILANGNFQLTGDAGNGFSGVYHGWGGPLPRSPWIPQIYRRVRHA